MMKRLLSDSSPPETVKGNDGTLRPGGRSDV